MAAQQTKLTQSQLAQLSQRHEDVAQQVTSQQSTLSGSIDTLASANRGDMMTSLKNVHEQWNKACSDIVKNLQQMAQQVNTTGRETQNKDEEVASSVRQVQTPGLTSFMS